MNRRTARPSRRNRLSQRDLDLFLVALVAWTLVGCFVLLWPVVRY